MSNFVNTVDVLGDDAVVDSIINKTITEYFDNNVESVGECAFYGCSELISVNLPNVKSIGKWGFLRCTKLESAIFDNLTSIDSYGFLNCQSLINVNFPKVTSISGHSGTDGRGAFQGCKSLVDVNLPLLTAIPEYCFYYCTQLQSVTAPLITSVGSSGGQSFYNCTALEIIDLYNTKSIGGRCFYNCSNLSKVILRNESTVCSITSSAFDKTPIADNTGYIYVPAALYSQYCEKYPQYTFRIIEGGLCILNNNTPKSYLEYNSIKPISMGYIIDTEDENVNASIPTVTVVPDDETIATISDISVVDGVINFNINVLDVTGETNIVVTATAGDFTDSITLSISVLEEISEVTYTVEAVDGATYGFELNDNGYYESTNKGVNSSYSICKLSFSANGINNLYLDCISSGESNYDYGIISNIDTTLTSSHTADSTNVLKSFKSLASTEVQTVDLGVPEIGEHFVYIKYIKDTSSNSGNDSLQFKVRVE